MIRKTGMQLLSRCLVYSEIFDQSIAKTRRSSVFFSLNSIGLRCERYYRPSPFLSARPDKQQVTRAAHDFLRKIETGRIKKGLVCQSVESLLLQLLAQDTLSDSAGPVALDLLDRALHHANFPNERLIPRLFSLACQVFIRSGHPLALKEVHRQLWRLLKNHRDFLVDDLKYNSHHVNDACALYIQTVVLQSNHNKKKIPHGVGKGIKRLIEQMNELFDDASVPLVANADSCNAMIMFYCNQGKPELAKKLLVWMIHDMKDHPIEVVPRVMSFTATISAFAKINPELPMEILQWMLEESERKPPTSMPPPNYSCFNSLMDAWAKSGRHEAGEKAQQILEWMEQLSDTKGLDTAPDAVSFNCCINAWANSPHPQSAQRAEAILRRMVSLYEGGKEVVPTNHSFISAMNAWANSGSPDAPKRVQALIDLLRILSKESSLLKVDTYCYAVLIKAWEHSGGQKVKVRGRGQPRTFNSVDEILTVLHQMELNGIDKTPVIHNAVIMALSKESALSSLLYFLELEEDYREGKERLETRTFNSALTAIAALNKPDIFERSIELYRRMLEYSESDPHVVPDKTTFNLILKALSRSPALGSAHEADELLKVAEAGKSFEPTSASYVMVIIAWGRSSDENKFLKVQDLLKRYCKFLDTSGGIREVNPNVFNAALSVCQHNIKSDFCDQSLSTLYMTMEKLRHAYRIQPDEETYLTLFRAIRAAPNESEDKCLALLEKEFANCQKEGLVSLEIVHVLRSTSSHVFERFFGHKEVSTSADIPSEWSRRTRSNCGRRNPSHKI